MSKSRRLEYGCGQTWPNINIHPSIHLSWHVPDWYLTQASLPPRFMTTDGHDLPARITEFSFLFSVPLSACPWASVHHSISEDDRPPQRSSIAMSNDVSLLMLFFVFSRKYLHISQIDAPNSPRGEEEVPSIRPCTPCQRGRRLRDHPLATILHEALALLLIRVGGRRAPPRGVLVRTDGMDGTE